MKALIDTNVILDIILERQPFWVDSKQVIQTALEANFELFLTATTVTDLYYIVRKAKGKETALRFIVDLLGFVEIAAVDKQVLLNALALEITDFEDAVQASSAYQLGIPIIITRNVQDFSHLTNVEIHTPTSFLQKIG